MSTKIFFWCLGEVLGRIIYIEAFLLISGLSSESCLRFIRSPRYVWVTLPLEVLVSKLSFLLSVCSISRRHSWPGSRGARGVSFVLREYLVKPGGSLRTWRSRIFADIFRFCPQKVMTSCVQNRKCTQEFGLRPNTPLASQGPGQILLLFFR